MGEVSDEAQRVRDETTRRRGEELQCSKMFHELSERACNIVASFSVEGAENPLETDDANYIDFLTRLVERLEVSFARWDEIRNAQCRDFPRHASTPIFSNLLCIDGDLDFNRVLSLIHE